MDVDHALMDFPYVLGCCLGLHAVGNKKSEAGILHFPLFPDILLFRAMGFGVTRTIKPSSSEGAVLCDVGGHTEKAGVKA